MPARTSKSLSTTEVAILGVLTWGPFSGYDLKKAIDESVGYFWGPAKSQIYAVLPRLVEAGYATSRKVEQSRRPDKTIYRITPAGRAALKSWIEDTPPPPDPDRNPLLLKLFFGHVSSPQVLLEQVRARREEAEQLRRMLEEVDADSADGDVYASLTRAWGHEYASAVIRWARKAEARLRGEND